MLRNKQSDMAEGHGQKLNIDGSEQCWIGYLLSTKQSYRR